MQSLLRALVKVRDKLLEVAERVVDFVRYGIDWFGVLFWGFVGLIVLFLGCVIFLSLARGGAIHFDPIPTSTPYPHGYKHTVCTTTLIPFPCGKTMCFSSITNCHEVTEP
jgi:hypothetical protein